MSIVLALVTAVLFACGSWLLMQRRLTRIVIGIGLLGHGAPTCCSSPPVALLDAHR